MSMRDRIKKTVANVDDHLATTELELLLKTELNLNKLTPDITSHSLYPQLIRHIENATQANLNVAQLESQIRLLGDEGWKLVKKIINGVK